LATLGFLAGQTRSIGLSAQVDLRGAIGFSGIVVALARTAESSQHIMRTFAKTFVELLFINRRSKHE
jgi:hypothetical protein